MKYCEKCGKTILDNEGFYKSTDIILCENCGDKDLCKFELEDGLYIHNDDYRETYSDEHLSDVIVYYRFENEEERKTFKREILHRVVAVDGSYQSKCPHRDEMCYCPTCPFSYSEDAPEDEFYECWDCRLQVGNHWLPENSSFKFYSAEEYDGELFEVYTDDYGQSFVLAWIDPVDRKVQEWNCGSYNSYIWDMEDIAASIKRKREQNGEEKNQTNTTRN